jgi:hypothetical protein
MSNQTETDAGGGGVVRRTIQGREALVYTDPDEIRVEWRVGRPVYFGVRAGDRIKDADRDVESPLIDEWEVVEITPDRVVGVDDETGRRRKWDRETLERGLTVGNFATNLSAFERVAAHRVGADLGDRSHLPHDPYVTVIAYGNNGERYGRRYRFLDDDGRRVALRDEDPSVGRLPAEHRDALEELVVAALEDDGYEVVVGEYSDAEPEIDEE